MSSQAPQRVFKTGRVCILLTGRMAGKKCVILSSFDNGNRQRNFPHAFVFGISRSPKKITKSMSKEKADSKSNIKIFLKNINYSHLMPTRYVLNNDLEIKSLLSNKTISTREESKAVKKQLADELKKKFLSSDNTTNARNLVYLRKRLYF